MQKFSCTILMNQANHRIVSNDLYIILFLPFVPVTGDVIMIERSEENVDISCLDIYPDNDKEAYESKVWRYIKERAFIVKSRKIYPSSSSMDLILVDEAFSHQLEPRL